MTLDQLYLALAKEVPNGLAGADFKAVPTTYQKWSEIDPALPRYPIKVYGPPPTSGTRDAFVELVMEPGCLTFARDQGAQGIRADGEARAPGKSAQTLREDGGYIDSGENDNLIVQKLEDYPAAFGIFGYSFLYQNADTLQAATVNGVLPTFESIASGTYPISRTLYVYVKNAHAQIDPGRARVSGRVHQRTGDRPGRLPGGKGPDLAAAGAARGIRSTRDPEPLTD